MNWTVFGPILCEQPPQNIDDISLRKFERVWVKSKLLKTLAEVLHLLTEALDALIADRCSKDQSATRHHGLASFLNEIIQLIFWQLFSLYEGESVGSHDIIRDMSLVSRRFRETVLAFTDLWTYLD